MNRLICQMIVKDEANRYLASVLQKAVQWADKIIIVDDCSTDNTVEICRSFGPKVEVVSHQFGKSMFGENESVLREYLWNLVRREAKEGDWIVSLDADEEFSSNFTSWARGFITSQNPYEYVTFKLLDMWTPTQYRVDGLWSPLITRMFRYHDQPFGLTGTLHCGCVPAFAWMTGKEFTRSDIKLKHLGWINDEDKSRKFDFYIKKATGINFVHAKSIKAPALLHTYTEELPTVLVASLIRNRAWCLPEFLKALDRQSKSYPSDKISYLFIINDSVDDSEKILKNWAINEGKKYKEVKLAHINFANADAVDHTWSDTKLANMALMRDKCLELLQSTGNDFLFSIDSDIILQHSDTLKHLVGLDKTVVSEVFWATWEHQDAKPLPNVWLSGGYHITEAFLKKLQKPGLYEVGGLGAVTLIHKDVLDKGLSYQRVINLPADMRGEDRDFCIRAACAGVKLWADTYRTPLHLERTDAQKKDLDRLLQQKDLEKLQEHPKEIKEEQLVLSPGENTVSLCMIVKNEVKNIKGALSSVRPLVQEMIVVDTGSTDGTREAAKEFTDQVYEYTWDDDFSAARNFAISKAKGKWILFLDGDELVPTETLKHFHQLIQSPELSAVLVPVKNVHVPTPDRPTNFHYSETYRLFKNIPQIRFDGCVHEDIASSLEEMAKDKKVHVVRATQFITNLGFLLRAPDLQTKHNYYGKLLLKEIDRRPDYFKPYYEYAVFLLDKGELDEAQKYYEKALELNPNFWMALNDQAVILLKKAINPELILEAAGYLDLAAVSASKKASQHQQQVIGTNVSIVRQLMKYFHIGPKEGKVPSQKNDSKTPAENLIK